MPRPPPPLAARCPPLAAAGSRLRSLAKGGYYAALALAYGLCGGFADVVMANSSWTAGHVRRLWWRASPPALVYPPADIAQLAALPLERKLKKLYLVGVAQFRPEKGHALLLRAYARARASASAGAAGDAVRASQLYLVGGCRGAADEARLAELQALAASLGLGASVRWHVDVPFDELKALLGGAVGGVHAMVDEHFGISVVEYMAAGAVPIAHNSGGPRADIVVPSESDAATGELRAGFLAASVEEYAAAMATVLTMPQPERRRIAEVAQRRAAAFSTERFTEGFTDAVAPLLPRGGGR